ncbi:hypothetical protein [Streptomyces prasinus]
MEPDLTREQFRRGQTVVAARAVERPPGPCPVAGRSTSSRASASPDTSAG